jgi:dinuclear metal center YbgI/SA1388 family protein
MRRTMKIKAIISYLEELVPLSTQEDYDNCGLITGNPEQEVAAVLLTLDCTEEVIHEAISKGISFIIAHHPIVFKGLKKFNGKSYVERAIILAIKHDIAIYAIHTNLDNYALGVNHEIGQRLGLKNLRILQPKQNALVKLVVFCPSSHVAAVSQALFDAGAGKIGNYDQCSFETSGNGYFRPLENAKPYIGETGGTREKVDETKIEVICPTASLSAILSAMQDAHPYEEVAHDIFPMLNKHQDLGSGMIGELNEPVEITAFLKNIKQSFNCGVIRYTKPVKDKIQRVAFCGGSGSFLIPQAIRNKADIYITGDIKYHEFFDAEDHLVIADIGHFESEQFTPHLISAILKKKFINFAAYLSEVKTNPVNYL